MERKRLSASEQTALIDLMAVTDRLDQLVKAPSMKNRISSIPRGRWRIMTGRSQLLKLCEDMLDTVPAEQLTHMKRNLKNVRCWIYIGKTPPVRKDDTDGRFLSINDLNTCAEAIKECCQMCSIEDKVERRKCKRAKLMDCLPMAADKVDNGDCGWFETLGSI